MFLEKFILFVCIIMAQISISNQYLWQSLKQLEDSKQFKDHNDIYSGYSIKTFHNRKKKSMVRNHLERDLGLKLERDPYKSDFNQYIFVDRYALKPNQMITIIDGTTHVDHKVRYANSLKRQDQLGGINGYNSSLFNPVSYDLDFNITGTLSKDEQVVLNEVSGGIWIIKPAYEYGGVGIQMVHDINSVKQALIQKQNNEQINAIQGIDIKKYGQFTLQKYIDKPLLLNNDKKFDYRCYVGYIHSDPLIAVYIPGYIRETMVKYDPESTDLMTHIGNGKYQRGYPNYWKLLRKSSYDMRLFKEKLLNKFQELKEKDYDKLISKLKAAMTYSILSAKDKFRKKKGDVQIQGIDIVMDEKLNPYVVEFNSEPYATPDNPCFEQIFPDIFWEWVDVSMTLHQFSKEYIIAESQKNPNFVCQFFVRQELCQFLVNDASGYNYLQDHDVNDLYQ